MLNVSAIDELLRALSGGGYAPNPGQVGEPEAPPPGLMQGAMPAPQRAAMSLFGPGPAPSAPPIAPPSQGGLFRRLIGGDELPAGAETLLTPEQQRQVRPGLLSMVGTFLAEGKSPREQIMDRVRQAVDLGALAEDKAKERAFEASRKRIAEQFAPPENETSDQLNLRLRKMHDAFLRSGDQKMAAHFSGIVNSLQPDRPAAPPTPHTRNTAQGVENYNPATGQWEPAFDAQGKRIMPWDSTPPTERRPQRQLTTIKVDGKDVTGWANADAGTFTPIGAAKGSVSQDRANAAYKKSLSEIAQSDRLLANAVDMVKANPDAFGLKNLLPGVVRERLPGRDNALDAATKGAVEAVVGELRHARFGGAITKQEAELSIALFTKPNSPPDVILAKLAELRKMVEARRAGLQEGYGAGAATGKTKAITVNGKTFIVPDE